jgi:hypothetical protein
MEEKPYFKQRACRRHVVAEIEMQIRFPRRLFFRHSNSWCKFFRLSMCHVETGSNLLTPHFMLCSHKHRILLPLLDLPASFLLLSIVLTFSAQPSSSVELSRPPPSTEAHSESAISSVGLPHVQTDLRLRSEDDGRGQEAESRYHQDERQQGHY